MNIETNPGYKLTEVGVIPDDWKIVRLAELLQEGRNVRYGVVQPGRFVSDGCFMLRSQDYSKGWSGECGMHRISRLLEAQFKNAKLNTGDIVMTVVGAGIGQVEVIPHWLEGAVLSRSTARIAVDEHKAEKTFIKYYLESPVIIKQLRDCQKEGAQPVVSCPDLSRFVIPCPPRPQQNAIATVLADIDALISGLNLQLAKKRDIKQAAMQKLLNGQQRLPGFNGEWEVKQFSDVLSRVNGKNYQIQTTDYKTYGAYPVVDQGKDRVVAYSDSSDKLYSCPDGGVIVFGDHTCVIKYIDFDFIVGADGTQIIRAKLGECTRFLAYKLELSGITSTGYNRHFKFLKELQFSMPLLEEQIAIAAFLSDMDSELSRLETRRDKARRLKLGIMQELLTGRIRLSQISQEARLC